MIEENTYNLGLIKRCCIPERRAIIFHDGIDVSSRPQEDSHGIYITSYRRNLERRVAVDAALIDVCDLDPKEVRSVLNTLQYLAELVAHCRC
jgi:hypothetical protein